MKMKKEDIESRLENITLQLQSPDIQFQAAALDAFIELISNQQLKTDQKKKTMSFLEKILNEPESSLRTECFKAVCLIGSKEFELIKGVFPIFFKELEKKNRFRSEIILDMFIILRNSNNPLIQDHIKEIIKNTPKWFNESYLIPVIEKFWVESTIHSFQFIDKYLNEIKEEVPNYPDKIKNLIAQKLKEYDNYIKEIKAQKEKEAKIKEEKLRIREELKRKEEETKRKKLLEKKEMMTKIEEYAKTISNQQELVSNEDIKTSEINTYMKEITEIKESTEDEAHDFTTFTNLGLKRKNVKEDE